MKRWIKRGALAVLALLIAAGVYVAFAEKPVAVDLAEVARAPMTVTIDEEGVTRVREVYTLSAPIAGHVDRSTLSVGDPVIANETVVAAIHPLDPPLLDARTAAELAAAEQAARSAIGLASAERERAVAARDLAQHDYERASRLSVPASISESELERSWSELQLAEAQVRATEATIRLRNAELDSVRAQRLQPDAQTNAQSNCCVEIRSPVDGVVLDLVTESEQAVAVGSVIAEIGDPKDLEVEVDVLSRDAVRLAPGTPVTLDDWGGERPITGRVERIEPAAFTRVSALGIEEQRVNVIVALEETPPELGHGYRVFAEMAIWSAPDALQVPISALFRDGGDWAVFTVEEDRAAMRTVTLGRMNDTTAEVLDGLAEGERVIPFPSDLVTDGVMIEPRDGVGQAS